MASGIGKKASDSIQVKKLYVAQHWCNGSKVWNAEKNRYEEAYAPTNKWKYGKNGPHYIFSETPFKDRRHSSTTGYDYVENRQACEYDCHSYYIVDENKQSCYRTVTPVYKYYCYKYTDWSSETFTTSKPSTSDTCRITSSGTIYRYRKR